MPIGVTPIPGYLNTNPNAGIENYLRAQQQVQQRQAQIAAEKHQQDQLALQAQAQAQQAAIHQQELGLRQQAQKAAVDTAAQRLQLGQQHESARQKEAEAEQAYRNSAPQAFDVPGVGAGVYKGGTVLFHKPGTVAGSAPVPIPNPDGGPPLGYDYGGKVLHPSTAKASSEEKAAAEARKNKLKDLDQTGKRLERLIDKDRASLIKAPEAEELSWQRQFKRNREEREAFNSPPAKAAPEILKPSPKSSSGVRLKRKSDGKILRYFGDPADVKTNEFEIVE